MPKPIQSPAPCISTAAVAYEEGGDAIIASAAHPLPISEVSYRAARQAALATALSPGRAIAIVAVTPGTLTLELTGGGSIDVPVELGLTILPFAVSGVSAIDPAFLPTLALLD